jgi:putative tricarboxylic transport membrane protein
MMRLLLLLAWLMLPESMVCAADWRPERRVELIVPNAPGGGNDRLARLIIRVAEEEKLHAGVITVVNKPGAGVVMGLQHLNQHAGDGHYTAIISSTFLGDIASGRGALGIEDITPIAQLFTEYVALAVKAESPLKSGRDVLARLKADVGGLSMSYSGGPGNHNHLSLAMLARAAGADAKRLKTVVHASGAEAATAVLGGHVDVLSAPASTVLPHAAAGRLRMLMLTAPKRLEGAFAAVPSWKELGVSGTISNWRAVVGPRALPAAQAAYWENLLARVVEGAEWKKMLERDGVTPEFLRGARMREELRADYAELKAMMGELGLVK